MRDERSGECIGAENGKLASDAGMNMSSDF